MRASEIDLHLKVTGQIVEPKLVWHHYSEDAFCIYGLLLPNNQEPFHRIPKDVASSISKGVESLSLHTSGGRIRFQTDSPFIAIMAEQNHETGIMPHMAFLGSSGFDLYYRDKSEYQFGGSFIPPIGREDSYESIIKFGSSLLRDITINFPLYDQVKDLFIGLQEGCTLLPARKYSFQKPVVFYGSSITQGGCASRPGTCYEAILSRQFDFDFLNFGFSGSAYGEPLMAEYLSSLDPLFFVMDYDHNAPDADHLTRTHYPFYSILRNRNPNTPILFITRPKPLPWDKKQEIQQACKDVILHSYKKGIQNEDRNLFYLDGSNFFEEFGDLDCTVDGTHPNDLGFYCMSKKIGKTLERLLLT